MITPTHHLGYRFIHEPSALSFMFALQPPTPRAVATAPPGPPISDNFPRKHIGAPAPREPETSPPPSDPYPQGPSRHPSRASHPRRRQCNHKTHDGSTGTRPREPRNNPIKRTRNTRLKALSP